MWSSARFKRWSEAPARHPELPLPVEIRAIRGARRLRLRFDDKRQLLKLTCPPRTSRSAALAWAAEQRAWVEAQIARAGPGEPFAPGARILLEGRETLLLWQDGAKRTPQREGDTLVCGGPAEGFARRIELYLKRLALDKLSRETAVIALAAGVSAAAVSIGDADTRWGSCSARRRIRFSWRLILAPPDARRFVVAHEVAHLRHLNHGPEFKALEAQLFGGPVAPARALLARLGPRLRRIGRSH